MRHARIAFVAALCASTILALPLTAADAARIERGSSDSKLTAAIVGNRPLQARCGGCIRKVEWIGASYARVTVDAAAWRHLLPEQRKTFARDALRAASNVYLQEWAAGDIYQKILIVSPSGAALMSFEP